MNNLTRRANFENINMKTIEDIENFIITVLSARSDSRASIGLERRMRTVSLNFLNKIEKKDMYWGNQNRVYDQFRKFRGKFAVTPNYYKEFFKWHSENFTDNQFKNLAYGVQQFGAYNISDVAET